jgi:hypothetical protein
MRHPVALYCVGQTFLSQVYLFTFSKLQERGLWPKMRKNVSKNLSKKSIKKFIKYFVKNFTIPQGSSKKAPEKQFHNFYTKEENNNTNLGS